MTIPYFITKHTFRIVAKILWRHRLFYPERVQVEGPCLIAVNHASFLDPLAVGSFFPGSIYYLARKTLFHGFLAWLLPRLQALPVDQDNPEVSTLKRMVKVLKDGHKLLIFPEGERTWDGYLKTSGEAGVGFVAAKAGVPVLPVRIFGAYEAYPRGAKFPKPGRVSVVPGPLLDFGKFPEESGLSGKELYQAISDRIMQAIAAIELPGGA